MQNDLFLDSSHKKDKSIITISSSNKNLNFNKHFIKKESIILQENNQNNNFNNNAHFKIKSANAKSKYSPFKVSLYDRKNTIFLPNISENSGVEVKKKEFISKYSQRASEKLRLSMRRTKSKINTAFVNNEEEEHLKKNRF